MFQPSGVVSGFGVCMELLNDNPSRVSLRDAARACQADYVGRGMADDIVECRRCRKGIIKTD